MAMSYTSLTGTKGTSGALATWVDYTKLDVPVIVDEAQALLWGLGLRCREMKTDLTFAVPVGGSYIALPTGFLDPIGRIYQTSFNKTIRHKDQNYLQRMRNYSETSGTLGASPFTTVNGSNAVTVALANHGFNQDSVFNTSGATAFNGVTIAGTFPITAIVDTNDFTIDITSLGTTPNAGGSGGGSAVAYVCDNLVAGMPEWYGIWNETIYFDAAMTQVSLCKLQYYKTPTILSVTNQTNFLTNRYPQILRTACQTSAADFMKDEIEYQKGLTRLQAMIQQVSTENDMSMRGMELEPEIP
jgi:hypothetical protein